jgi:Rps23 Pro-64 3,4-dihydroxylase Tpa1-like proline 4-hydroxylase
MELNNLIEDYNKNGYVVVDDFLPNEEANKLEELYYNNSDWTLSDQVRDDLYSESHFQSAKTKSIYLPKENESYSAKFWSSDGLVSEIESIHDKYFKPMLENISQVDLNDYNLRCYKMDEGCHYRTHLDQWVSSVGCLYYINRDWIWDWGGIFHLDTASELSDDSDSVIPIFPKFNRALIINNTLDKFKFPHFVSHVTDYAMNPRFTLVTFGKESK